MLGEIYLYGTNFIGTMLLLPQYIGLISQAQKFGELINRAISSIQIPLYPLISRSNKKDSLDKIVKVYRIIFFISCLLALTTCIILKPFVHLFYGEEFIPIVKIFYILTPGLIMESASLVLKSYCNGIGKAIISSYILLVPMILQLILSFVLIKDFGYIGAAASLSIGKVLFGFLFLMWFTKYAQIPIVNLLPSKHDLYFILDFLKERFIFKKS